MNLSKYIAELLVKNNCVIVPNFGGFIANYKPAVIDELRHKIYPPSKRILFNSNLLSNDGLLANYVSIQISKSYSESLTLIDEVSTEWKTKLNNGERVSIGEVGFIYEVDNKIQFEQDREFNLYLGAYGLSTVSFVSHTEEVNEPVKAVDNTDSIIEFGAVAHSVELTEKKKEAVVVDLPTEVKRKKSNRWKYLAVACFLPALFYSYWIPMETHYLNSGNIQMADFNPLQKKAVKIYNTRFEKNEINDVEIESSLLDKSKISASNVKFYNYQFSDELYIPVDLKAKAIKVDKTEVAKVEEVIVKKETKTIEKHFHLIAGCFGSESNADILVADLKSKGYASIIIDKNKGLYRVAVQSFESKKKAIDFKSKLASNSISSWLLTK
jgi:hypothetical protein